MYGRKNVLAILFSDVHPAQNKTKKPMSSKEKWFLRLLICITLFLIITILLQRNDTTY
jgi:hypothetical protein